MTYQKGVIKGREQIGKHASPGDRRIRLDEEDEIGKMLKDGQKYVSSLASRVETALSIYMSPQN